MNRLSALFLGAAVLAGGPALAAAPPAKPAASAAPIISADPAQYLAAIAKQPGVIVLPTGLQYKVLQAGPPGGPSPKEGDIIKVEYEGALSTGEVFDSTAKRGRPAIMQLVNLVPAWMEAVPMMHVGDEWMLYVPPSLGYGDQGAGPIPPGSVLVFRIKLLGMLTTD